MRRFELEPYLYNTERYKIIEANMVRAIPFSPHWSSKGSINVNLGFSHGRLDSQLASVQEVLIEEPPQRVVWLRTTRL